MTVAERGWLVMKKTWPWRTGICRIRDGLRREMATLACKEILVPSEASEQMRTVMFVHGLLGSGRNWQTFAKNLASSALPHAPPGFPGFRMILVDLRNHGKSASLPGFAPPHDMQAAARDVAELIAASSWGSPEMIISHSMGGKVALEFGRNSASGQYGAVLPPKQLWVLDSVLGVVPEHSSTGEVERVLSAIQSLPHPIPSRRWLINHMVESGFSKDLSDWLGSNLTSAQTAGDEMTWIFNPKEANEMFLSYCEMDYWSMLESPPQGMEIGIVRAMNSDRWKPDIIQKLEILARRTAEKPSKIKYHILENAGHWLHVDNPGGLADILRPYVVKLSTGP